MAVLHRRVRVRQLPELERKLSARRAQERAQAEAGARADRRLRDEVEKELIANREAREAFARLSPEEKRLRNLELEQQARRPIDPKDIRKYPDGWMMARSDVLSRWAREADEERQKAERKAGIPQAQKKWDGAREEIIAARDVEVREARERCRESKRGADERSKTTT